MRILEFDELPPDTETQAQLLDLSVAWAPVSFSKISEVRKMGYPCADYVGVYAVEKGEILSAVRVLRLPYTTPEGVRQIAGIQGVVTRRDSRRRGVARELLREVHRREKAAGCEYSMLWTGRGLVAHSLYESLGYRDVYTPDLAVLHKSRNRGAGRYVLESLGEGGTRVMEELHASATAGRLGFTPRPSGMVRSAIHLGFLPADSLFTIRRGGKDVGYAVLQKHHTWCSLEELVLDRRTPIEEVLPTLEASISDGWFVIRNTVVRDLTPLLQRRGYHCSPWAYYSLLALPLKRSGEDVVDMLGTGDRLFTCQGLDYF